MMKTKLLALAIALFSFTNVINAEFTGEMPSETAFFKPPGYNAANWKEIARYVSKKDGVVEFIPLDQTTQNWSELIAIQYFNDPSWDKSARNLTKMLEHIRKETLASYPENTATWQLIEKNKEGIIYEWILHKPFNNIPIQHDVSRAFLSSSGFHRVGFTKKNTQLSAEEREKWIKLLRENSSVVSFNDGRCLEGFSLVEKLKDSVSLGQGFQNWKEINQLTFENGYSSTCHIPPTQVDHYVSECLESVTMPNVKNASLTKLFEIEKKCIREKTTKKVKFHILEQSPTEIIYSYSHPRDHLELNAVVRTFLTPQGYYSISYKKGLEGQLQQEEILSWGKKLKSITVKTSIFGCS